MRAYFLRRILDTSPESFLLPSSRRRFLQQASTFGLLYSSSRAFAQVNMAPMQMGQRQTAPPVKPNSKSLMLHTLELTPFVDPLPLPQIACPAIHNGKRSLTVTMQEIHAKVHRDVPPTRMWSCGPTPPPPPTQPPAHPPPATP